MLTIFDEMGHVKCSVPEYKSDYRFSGHRIPKNPMRSFRWLTTIRRINLIHCMYSC